ncbi:hypothetical protein SAMN05421736_101159 [Evansella caseinilytica]|uniref:Uncharacterized protein n=1 Tax=Evansella caseinilytica TaxID=1503961 RepID=A0A1H3GFX0_9BACI|nr:hypothetical protein [Evansella caseinilytica]SDY02186.1 hypothetical protein SAMN05421736_101159 [Evansella caseinilytica]
MDIDLTAISKAMPDFKNHEQAKNWFEEHFHDRFTFGSSDIIDGKKVFYYHLIEDPEVYQQYMESFAKEDRHNITDVHTFESYATVEISEDGGISLSL